MTTTPAVVAVPFFGTVSLFLEAEPACRVFPPERLRVSEAFDQTIAEDFRQTCFAYLARRRFVVIRDADIGQHVSLNIESAVAGGWVVIAWLSDGAENGDPASLREQGISTDCAGSKPVIFPVGESSKSAGT